jgi:3-oxoacyl-[acyl-carrier protein] reductase
VTKPVALVTGGSRGIGRAIVLELSKDHEVIATYHSNHEAAEKVARESGATLIPCPMHQEGARADLLAELRRRFHHIDLLVNNAGIAPRERRDLLDATPESFDELIAVNLKGPYFLTQQVARWMLEHNSGRIVFIGSISAFAASVTRGDYCLTKAAIAMAVKLFAARLAPDNIPVFEIEPGIIRTDMITSVAAIYEQRIAAGLLPQPRIGEPEDVAKAVRLIAEGYLDYSTGQVLHVDGGFHLRTL